MLIDRLRHAGASSWSAIIGSLRPIPLDGELMARANRPEMSASPCPTEASLRVVMGFPNRSRSKQVRLAVFDSEPMARLAEQRLWESGIPSLTRCLRGGPGIWGSAYNLPHDLYVYEADQELARQVLELPDVAESEEQETPARSNWGLWFAVAIITLTLVLGIIVPLISQPG